MSEIQVQEQALPQQQEGKKPAPRKRKSRRKWIILGIVAVLVVAVAAVFFFSRPTVAVAGISSGDVTTLEKGDVRSTISATGTVESADSTSVYSTLTYKVDTIYVEVGDAVRQGDALAQLDTQTLERSIAAKELSIATSEVSTQQSIKSARDTYNAAATALNEGKNSTILTAENTVEQKHEAWIQAQEDYETYKQKLEEGIDSSLMTQQNTVSTAKTSLETAERTLRNARDSYDRAWDAYVNASEGSTGYSTIESAYFTAKSSLETAEAGLVDAEAKLAYEQKKLDIAEGDAGKSLEDYEKAIDDAWKAYEDAVRSLEAAQYSAQTTLQGNKNSLDTAINNANNDAALLDLTQLKEDLEATTITAPVSGTVTAVYATVGSSGSGLLFVIEDTGDLIVETTVREYDIGTVSEGLRVLIESDATGEAQYDGTIDKIAPTSQKTAAGATDTSGDIVFPTEVAVTSADTALRIGMSVRLNIVVAEATDTLYVPYEAVYTNARGEACVIALEYKEEGTVLLKEVPVTIGVESDLDIAVTGEGLSEGMQIVSTASSYQLMIGQQVPLTSTRTLPEGASGGMMMMMGGMRP